MQPFNAELVSQLERPRSGERRKVRAAAQCRRGSMRETVEVLDLSTGGARVRALAPLRVGHSIWLRLPGIEAQEARVAWTRGFESGCEFVHLLHPAILDALIGAREQRRFG